MIKSFPPILVFATIIVSCGTSNKYMADDVYVLKPSELAIGESSADETTYSAFKKRKQGDVSDKQIYADQQLQTRYSNCLNMVIWQPNCGCSYSQWTNSSPYSNSFMRNQYYGFNQFSNSQSFAMMGWNYPYSMYGGYNPYYNMYGYSNYHSNYYGYGSYGSYGYNYNPYGYGFGYGGYGYAGNSYGGGGSSVASNVYNGPRGTSSGYANPTGRHYSGTLKSTSANNPNTTGTYTKSNGSVVQRGQVERKPISEINSTPTFDRTGTNRTVSGRTVNPSSSGSHQYATSSRGSMSTSSPSRTNSGTNVTRSNSGQGMDTPRKVDRSISTPTQSRSTSGGSISGGSSSGGGSRSGGGSSSGNAGRRP